jgi:hypothetical protein
VTQLADAREAVSRLLARARWVMSDCARSNAKRSLAEQAMRMLCMVQLPMMTMTVVTWTLTTSESVGERGHISSAQHMIVLLLFIALSLCAKACSHHEAVENIVHVPKEELLMQSHVDSRKRGEMGPLRISFDFSYFATQYSNNDCRQVGQVLLYPGGLNVTCAQEDIITDDNKAAVQTMVQNAVNFYANELQVEQESSITLTPTATTQQLCGSYGGE